MSNVRVVEGWVTNTKRNNVIHAVITTEASIDRRLAEAVCNRPVWVNDFNFDAETGTPKCARCLAKLPNSRRNAEAEEAREHAAAVINVLHAVAAPLTKDGTVLQIQSSGEVMTIHLASGYTVTLRADAVERDEYDEETLRLEMGQTEEGTK